MERDLTLLSSQITAIIVNFKTRKLTQTCYESFREFYPDIDIFLIDNHSQDDSTSYIRSLWEEKSPNLTVILEPSNVGHGLAMDHAIQVISTPYFFTLDSDCEILKGGFLEIMLQEMDKNGNMYAIGWKRWIDRKTGVPYDKKPHSSANPPKFIPYIHPYAALYRLSMYRSLRPFADHGAPCIWNMNDAVNEGYGLKHMELKGYIKHWKAGTRRRFGGHWHPKEGEHAKAWDADKNYPI